MYNDEIYLSTISDGNLKSIEERLIKKIKNQITNDFGDFVGEITEEVDYILEYIKQVYISTDLTDIIENFEQFSIDSESEVEYDFISSNIIKLFKELIGIRFDIDRETISFEDIYNVYVIFVLSLKETVIMSTKGFYSLNGKNDVKITSDMISEYILSDEFSSNDDFIRNAAFVSQNELIKKIKNMIDDFLISIDDSVFMKFIYKFITETEFWLRINDGWKIK